MSLKESKQHIGEKAHDEGVRNDARCAMECKLHYTRPCRSRVIREGHVTTMPKDESLEGPDDDSDPVLQVVIRQRVDGEREKVDLRL